MTDDMHTCSYHCDRPECVRRQRDALQAELAKLRARIDAAPLHTVGKHLPTGITCIVCDASLHNERVRLLVEDGE